MIRGTARRHRLDAPRRFEVFDSKTKAGLAHSWPREASARLLDPRLPPSSAPCISSTTFTPPVKNEA